MDAAKSQGSRVNNADFCIVYTTAPDLNVAKTICRELVEQKFAACANILPQMISIYSWEGKMDESIEVSIILKTRKALTTKLEAKLKELHPYTTPCMIVLPLTGGSREYLAWVQAQTLDEGARP